MTIQNAVNQMLGSATIAAGLYAHSPAGKVASEKRALNRQAGQIEDRMKAIRQSAGENFERAKREDIEEAEGLAEETVNIRKRQYELNPTAETRESSIQSERALRAYKETLARTESRAENITRQRETVNSYNTLREENAGGGANG